MSQFYELQLILLTGFCIFALFIERYASKQKHSLAPRELRDPARLENGHTHNNSASISGQGGLATLTRKYLVVYVIVMGKSQLVWSVML
jgi:hypothetical protein